MACRNPAAPGHWTEAGAADVLPGTKARHGALSILQVLLAADGLTIRRAALAGGFHITAQSGRSRVAATIDEVWPLVQDLTGRPVDPLDVRFLRRGPQAEG